MEAERDHTSSDEEGVGAPNRSHSASSCLAPTDQMEAERDHTSSDEEGVGAPNRRHSASSSSSSKKSGKSVSTSSQKELNKSDENWPKDIPSEYQRCLKTFEKILRAAIHQGKFEVCWAVGLARCIEALYKIKYGITVHLSAQHLINNIRNKADGGRVTKYHEIRNFLINHGLVLEEACPFTGAINEECSKTCGGDTFKIKDLLYLKTKHVKEEEIIKLVNEGPVLAVVESYQSFSDYQDGIYNGPVNRKDQAFASRHVVLLGGFNTTIDGVNYWIIQNSWGTQWGQNGYGKIRRKSSRDGKPSLILKIIKIEV